MTDQEIRERLAEKLEDSGIEHLSRTERDDIIAILRNAEPAPEPDIVTVETRNIALIFAEGDADALARAESDAPIIFQAVRTHVARIISEAEERGRGPSFQSRVATMPYARKPP